MHAIELRGCLTCGGNCRRAGTIARGGIWPIGFGGGLESPPASPGDGNRAISIVLDGQLRTRPDACRVVEQHVILVAVMVPCGETQGGFTTEIDELDRAGIVAERNEV